MTGVPLYASRTTRRLINLIDVFDSQRRRQIIRAAQGINGYLRRTSDVHRLRTRYRSRQHKRRWR